MKIDQESASRLVSAYSSVSSVDAALTTLSKAAVTDPGALNSSFSITMNVGYNTASVVKDVSFHGERRREIVAFLIMAERRRLSAIRAGAIRTINQIGGVTPPPHPFAL